MSLDIEIDHVTGVLLKAGWHQVVENSFTVDAYEYVHREAGNGVGPGELLVGGGSLPGVSSAGAAWKESEDDYVACPVSLIIAVKYRYPTAGASDHENP